MLSDLIEGLLSLTAPVPDHDAAGEGPIELAEAPGISWRDGVVMLAILAFLGFLSLSLAAIAIIGGLGSID